MGIMFFYLLLASVLLHLFCYCKSQTMKNTNSASHPNFYILSSLLLCGFRESWCFSSDATVWEAGNTLDTSQVHHRDPQTNNPLHHRDSLELPNKLTCMFLVESRSESSHKDQGEHVTFLLFHRAANASHSQAILLWFTKTQNASHRQENKTEPVVNSLRSNNHLLSVKQKGMPGSIKPGLYYGCVQISTAAV